MTLNFLIALITIIIVLLILYVVHAFCIKSSGSKGKKGKDHHHRVKVGTGNDRFSEDKKEDKREEKKEEKDDDSDKITYQDSYTITVGEKTTANRFYDQGSKNCFYINGVEAPRIIMQRGVYYRLVNESDESFYFSSDPSGGPDREEDGSAKGNLSKNVKGFRGLARGTIYFMVSDDLPDTFYYQSSEHLHMGSAITLI